MATFLQERKENNVIERNFEPQWELFTPPPRYGHGEWVSVAQKGGTIRFSRDAYNDLLSGAEYVAVYVDRRSGMVGIRPSSEPDGTYKLSKAGHSISVKTLITELGLETGRYELRADVGGLIAFNPKTDRI